MQTTTIDINKFEEIRDIQNSKDLLQKYNQIHRSFDELGVKHKNLSEKQDVLAKKVEDAQKKIKTNRLANILMLEGLLIVILILVLKRFNVTTGYYYGLLTGFIVFNIYYIFEHIKHVINYSKARKTWLNNVTETNNIFQDIIRDYIFLVLLAYKVDIYTYKSIYSDLYNIQEHLREKNPKAFKVFEQSFEELGIDLTKYTTTKGIDENLKKGFQVKNEEMMKSE